MILENGGTENRRFTLIAIEELKKHFPISQDIEDMGERLASNIISAISYSAKSAFNRDVQFLKFLKIRVDLLVSFYNNQNKEYNKLIMSLNSMALNAYHGDVNNEREEYIYYFIGNEIRKYKEKFNINQSSKLIDAELLSYVSVLSRVSLRVAGRESNIFKLRYCSHRKQKSKSKEVVIDLFQLVETSFKKDKDTLDYSSRLVLAGSENLLFHNDVESMWKQVYKRFIHYLQSSTFLNKELVIDYVEKYVLEYKSTLEIAAENHMDKRQYDYLQQQVKYHAEKFMLADGKELIESWLDISVQNNLGLVETKWKRFLMYLTDTDKKILNEVRKGNSFKYISTAIGISESKVKTKFNRIVLTAKKIRNDAKNMKQLEFI